jgi:hypothetical protein
VGRLRVILVSGTVGVGKTSALIAIGDALAMGEAPYAIVDLDWLAWLRPDPARGATVRSVLVENLRCVSATFRRAGVEQLVLARAVRQADEVDAIRAALEPCHLVVARLVASAAVVERRLRGRDAGAQLAEHLAESASFAADAEDAGIGEAIATDELDASAVARAVLRLAGWSGGSR